METDGTEADLPPSVPPVHMETKPILNIVKDEQADASSTSPAEDSDLSEGLLYSVLEPSCYIFEKNLQIKLQKLSADDIARWTKPSCVEDATSNGYQLRAR